ncbi:hypothetical protein NHQ30_007918 [Ciborinia camelliae]|nr:hypothetical protein NHQ30_007918 [Ciborinia camelliae]
MSSSFQTSVTDLTGINMASNTSDEWEFQGKIITTKQYLDDFDADLTAGLAEHGSTSPDYATIKNGQYNKPANASPRPSSFDHHSSDSICVASSYADTEASMRPNYIAPSDEWMSQYLTYITTPTTSIDENGDGNVSSQNDSVQQHPQYAYSEFPTYISGPTPLDFWYDNPERHEEIAYSLSDPMVDPIAPKKIKKSADKKVQKRK